MVIRGSATGEADIAALRSHSALPASMQRLGGFAHRIAFVRLDCARAIAARIIYALVNAIERVMAKSAPPSRTGSPPG